MAARDYAHYVVVRHFRLLFIFFFFQAEDGIRDLTVTGVQTCALPIWAPASRRSLGLGRSHVLHPRRAQEGRGAARPARAGVEAAARSGSDAEIGLGPLARPPAHRALAQRRPADRAAGDLAPPGAHRGAAGSGRRSRRRDRAIPAVVSARASSDDAADARAQGGGATDGARTAAAQARQGGGSDASTPSGSACGSPAARAGDQIGRASCRERGEISVGAVSLKKKTQNNVQ